jgi:hypothetical protein
MKFNKLSFLLTILMFQSLVFAQQIDGLLKQKPFQISGGLGLNQNLYLANQIPDRFIPYTFIATGNVNVQIYGLSLPFTFNYSNQKLDYRTPQPFNIIGISPKYKKLTLHAGYRNMTFSSYTLAGHSYLGGGLEYQFPKLKVMAMGGRLLRSTSGKQFNEALGVTRALPNYARFGGGVKLGFKLDDADVDFIAFYAKDLQKSLNGLTDSINIRPEENQVYSIALKKPLNPKMNFNFEGALSAWTKNQQDVDRSQDKFYEYLYFVPLKQSTVFYSAFKTGLDVSLKKSKVGANFERVQPEYRTLGAYFINSDFQNVTLNISRPLVKGKVNFSANGGLQRDDLLNTKQTKMKRVVASANLSIKWSEKVNTTLNVSNFNSFINVKPVDRALLQNSPYDQIDTLNFVQINQSASLANQWKIMENDNIAHNFTSNTNYSRSSNNNSGVNVASNMLNGGLGYGIQFKKSNASINMAVNSSQNFFEAGLSSYYGATTTFSKPLFNKKVTANLGFQGNTNLEDGQQVALLYGISNGYSANIGKKHSVSLNMRYSGRQAKAQSQLSSYNTTFNEFMGTLGYNYKF